MRRPRFGPGSTFPVGASLCGVIGYGSPMQMDLFGGHTLGSISFSAAALGLFLAATVWMFRRWGGGASTPAILSEEESEAIWAELEQEADDPARPHEDVEAPRPV